MIFGRIDKEELVCVGAGCRRRCVGGRKMLWCRRLRLQGREYVNKPSVLNVISKQLKEKAKTGVVK